MAEIAQSALRKFVDDIWNAEVVPTLTKTGPDSITRPHLLDSWTVSEDLRSWTLNIRRDVRWRKGGRLTSQKVKIAARPYMAPALEQERPKLPLLWRNSIRKGA